MSESDQVRELRRDIGRELAVRRAEAGYTQHAFAGRIGYSRGTVSSVESGTQRAGAVFWQSCDRVLGTGKLFIDRHQQIVTRKVRNRQENAERERAARRARLQEERAAGGNLHAATVTEAIAAYEHLGWVTAMDGNRLEFVTGTAIDALEIPRPAGVLAMHWWLTTQGAPDDIRGLPALPHPGDSLAAVDAGTSFYFLTQAGACPWNSRKRSTAQSADRRQAVVLWHSSGSRIPAPPSQTHEGRHAVWGHGPAHDVLLPDPCALLHLLTLAADATRTPDAIVLPRGIVTFSPAWPC